jgi:hypothetical protein
MTNKDKYNLMFARYVTLSEKPKNIKSGGVLRKLRRKLRAMKKDN